MADSILTHMSAEPLTMTSREIAELTGKRHDNVKRTIETLAESGAISQPQIEDGPKAANGVIEKHYLVGKRDSYVIVAQLSPEFTARLVDRWQELENAAPRLPSHLETARMLVSSLERAEKAESALAIAGPKAAALDLISAREDSVTIREAAKLLGVPEQTLIRELQHLDWAYRLNGSWVAKHKTIMAGCAEYKEAKYTDNNGQQFRKQYFHITPKGLTKLAAILQKT